MKKCPFCAEEIQNEAIKCKHCGEMLNSANAEQSVTVTGGQITTERTSKHWKGLQLLGVALVIFGVISVFIAPSFTPQDGSFSIMAVMPGLSFLIGMGIYIYARIMAWWHHA